MLNIPFQLNLHKPEKERKFHKDKMLKKKIKKKLKENVTVIVYQMVYYHQISFGEKNKF